MNTRKKLGPHPTPAIPLEYMQSSEIFLRDRPRMNRGSSLAMPIRRPQPHYSGSPSSAKFRLRLRQRRAMQAAIDDVRRRRIAGDRGGSQAPRAAPQSPSLPPPPSPAAADCPCGRQRRCRARRWCRRRSWYGSDVMVRASPSCACCAIFCACALVSTASVAMQPMVVAVPSSSDSGSSPARIAARVSSSADAVGRARAGQHPAIGRIDHVADRVDRDDGADRQAVDRRARRCRGRPSSRAASRTACRRWRRRRRRRCLPPALRALAARQAW